MKNVLNSCVISVLLLLPGMSSLAQDEESLMTYDLATVSYTHIRAHETG